MTTSSGPATGTGTSSMRRLFGPWNTAAVMVSGNAADRSQLCVHVSIDQFSRAVPTGACPAIALSRSIAAAVYLSLNSSAPAALD